MTSSDTVRKLGVADIISKSIRNFPTVFREAWLPIILFTIPLCIGQQYFMRAASDANLAENTRIYNTLGALSFNLTETLILFLVLPNIAYGLIKNFKTTGVITHFKKNFKHMIIEVLRGMGSIALGLLLIFPGLRRLFEYIFIPYIVQFDTLYQQGKVDALVRSKQMVSGYLWPVSGVYLITGALNLLASTYLMGMNVFVSLWGWLIALLVYIGVEILTGYMICLTFVRLQGIKGE